MTRIRNVGYGSLGSGTIELKSFQFHFHTWFLLGPSNINFSLVFISCLTLLSISCNIIAATCLRLANNTTNSEQNTKLLSRAVAVHAVLCMIPAGMPWLFKIQNLKIFL